VTVTSQDFTCQHENADLELWHHGWNQSRPHISIIDNWLFGPMVCVGLQVQTALGAIVRESSVRELPCGVFGSFGWSGEAVDELENRLKVRPCLALELG
jgi:hypothetical protein